MKSAALTEPSSPLPRVRTLTALSAALQQAKLDYQTAQANYNIQVANIDDSAVRSAASAVSSAKAALLKLQQTPSQSDLQLAQASLDQAKLNVQQAQYNMRNAQLTAPFDGTVTQINLTTATSSTSGSSSATTSIQVTDLDALQVSVPMAEVDVSKIKLGQDVAVTSEWGTPEMFEAGLRLDDVVNRRFGHRLHFWDLRQRRHVESVDLGDQHQMVLELRPAHDPRKAHGFVGVVVDVTSLASSIWVWHRDGRRFGAMS